MDWSRGSLVAAVLLAGSAAAEPVRVFSANPHYFERQGRTIVFVTSDHHYGAVIDADFDYVRFLDALAASGMNLTRIYPGGMFEATDKYVVGNPLGPLPGRQILPWARSNQDGAHPGLAQAGQASYKYDLDRWNPAYFERLRDFVEQASRRGIVVEVAFFNGMYADSWPLMAFHHRNNVQGVGRYEAEECGLFTTRDARNEDVVRYQQAYVSKIAAELNGYDDVIFDLCDEPSLFGKTDGSIGTHPDATVVPWLLAMRDAFLAAEEPLPKKHVLGQTVQNLSPDLSAEPWCDWLPTEYVKPAGRALEKDYAARKPIVDVESDYLGHGLVKPYGALDVRLEGWWFLLGGGAGTINLNAEFHRGQEAGDADTRRTILPQRRVLKEFVSSLDLSRLARFEGVTGLAEGALASALAEPGRQYAVYLFHARDDGQWGAHFVATPGRYREAVTLRAVPPGRYRLVWTDPASGRELGKSEMAWRGGDLTL
ncbi:MAG TPA: DUF4038 domain-containing protein, partial [Vicinamibacteria bacterium]|nr:DUF4038 domain-containing protein [Vicinamibacteria bacterium]